MVGVRGRRLGSSGGGSRVVGVKGLGGGPDPLPP